MKKCFKCLIEKDLSEFYVHKQMADGHLNKCKECTKRDADEHFKRRMLEPEWREKELERHRKKSAKARLSGIQKNPAPPSRIYRGKYPEKYHAHCAVGNAVRDGRLVKKPCEVCGDEKSQGHHDDYSKPLEVVWLCDKHHKKRHIQLRQLKEHGRLIPF